MRGRVEFSSSGQLGENTQQLLQLLKSAGQTISFCESLTAGLASATFADSPGASTALRGGLITYATDLKENLAGVPHAVVEEFGVVSPQCAQAMAVGTRLRCSSDWAISLTGVAGPESQDGHPVGTVWIGIAGPHGIVGAFEAFEEVERLGLAKLGRAAIRKSAVQRSFAALINRLESA